MEILQVDAFTDRAFTGNPAAVCFLDGARDDAWMQAVAREMNLSETAFVRAGGEAWALRWFTPAVEVDLCGHATLAAAHALWETGRAGADTPLRFDTRAGRLGATRSGAWIELDFPARPPVEAEAPAGLAAALGTEPRWVGRSADADYLVLVGDAAAVRALRPDLARLREIDCRGVIVTAAAADDEHDFVSRFFAPAVGVDEDPVTGSAHCCLGPFWAGRLGRSVLRGFQASPRGGVVRVEVRGERVGLGGRAVTVLEGRLKA